MGDSAEHSTPGTGSGARPSDLTTGAEAAPPSDPPFSVEHSPKSARIARVGRYSVHGAIGSGGMATVHVGRLSGAGGFGRVVAIKRLHAQYAASEEFAARFVEEAKVASRVQHPNVVTVIDALARDGELLLVMDHVLGESLATLVAANDSPLPIPVAVAIVVDVLRGLRAAHEATDERGEHLGLVHRDVSPQNVLVGVDGVARLLDFGIAKVAREGGAMTEEGVVKGKVAYMAPEQLYGETLDHRADVYAVGVVLWELLTGRRLFAGDGSGSTATQVLDKPVKRPRAVSSGIAAGLDRVVMRAIDRDAEARFDDAGAMESALLEAMSPATPAEVGEIVQVRCGQTIAERRALLQQIEALPEEPSDDGAVPAEAPLESERPAGARLPWAAVGATVVVALLIGRYAVPTAEEVPPLPSSSAAVSASSPPPPPATSASARRPAAPAPRPSSSAEPVDVVPARPLARPPVKQPPPAPAVDCEPPYIIDERGHKKYKPECL